MGKRFFFLKSSEHLLQAWLDPGPECPQASLQCKRYHQPHGLCFLEDLTS